LSGRRPGDCQSGLEIAQATGKNKPPQKKFSDRRQPGRQTRQANHDNKFAFKPEN
jgi:hypothetical protein